MEVRKVKNKKGEILTTKQGVELEELRFEAGDEFVPQFTKVLEKTNEVEIEEKGQLVKKKITNYSLKCRARDRNKQQIKNKDSEDIFVTLTPSQAKSLKKKIEEGLELNQHLFVAYKYESKDYGEQIGLGLKKANKPAKTFDQLDKDMAEEIGKSSKTATHTQQDKHPTSADDKDSSEPIKIEDIK
jgi:hypothetical protein